MANDIVGAQNTGIDFQFNQILTILNIANKEFIDYKLDINSISFEQINSIIDLAPDFYDENSSTENGIPNKDFVNFINSNVQFLIEAYLISPNSDNPILQINGIKAPHSIDNVTLLNNFISNYRDTVNPPDIYEIQEGFIRAHWN